MSEEKTEAKEAPKKFAFFVGCTIRVRQPYIEKLARNIFKQLGVELVDLPFSCCPTAKVVKDVSIQRWVEVAARNLALAEKQDLPILSMCTGCTQTLAEAKEALEDLDERKRVNVMMEDKGLKYSGTGEVKFYAELLHEMMADIPIKKKLAMTIAAHPGCHILRPSRILKFDDPENPLKLDELIMLLGADADDYPKKGLCCGSPIYNVDPEAAREIMKAKMQSMHADCMAVLCPTCFEYYELRQKQMSADGGFEPVMVMHYLQLLGIAMGMSLEDVGYSQLRFRKEGFERQFEIQ